MRGCLVFRPESLKDLERVLGAAATALGAASGPWVRASFKRLPDASGDGLAFAQVSTRAGARLSVTSSCVFGNPREGWDYDGQVDLEAAPHRLEAHWSCGQQVLATEITLTTSELDDGMFLALKAAVGAAMLPGTDRTDQAFTALENIRRSSQPKVKAALLASALAYGATTGDRGAGWHEILRLGASSGAVGALQRIRETPGDPEGWAQAPAEMAEVAAHMVVRLSPWEGKGVWASHAAAWSEAIGGPRRAEGWWVHEDGLGPSEGSRVRELELFRDLGPPGTWPYGFYGEVFRVAAFVEGSALPRTHVATQKGELSWRWFGGPRPEDVAVVRTERVGVLCLPMEVWFGGSEAWKEVCRRAMDSCTQFQWVPPPAQRERAPRGVEAGPQGWRVRWSWPVTGPSCRRTCAPRPGRFRRCAGARGDGSTCLRLRSAPRPAPRGMQPNWRGGGCCGP
jgi:hypothetical protein